MYLYCLYFVLVECVSPIDHVGKGVAKKQGGWGSNLPRGYNVFSTLFSEEQGSGQGQCKIHEAEIRNGLRPPVFFSFEGKGNYYPLPFSAVSVGYLLLFRGQGQWLLYLKYLYFVLIECVSPIGHLGKGVA